MDSGGTSGADTVATILESAAQEVGVQVIPKRNSGNFPGDLGGIVSSQGPRVPGGLLASAECPVAIAPSALRTVGSVPVGRVSAAMEGREARRSGYVQGAGRVVLSLAL